MCYKLNCYLNINYYNLLKLKSSLYLFVVLKYIIVIITTNLFERDTYFQNYLFTHDSIVFTRFLDLLHPDLNVGLKSINSHFLDLRCPVWSDDSKAVENVLMANYSPE